MQNEVKIVKSSRNNRKAEIFFRNEQKSKLANYFATHNKNFLRFDPGPYLGGFRVYRLEKSIPRLKNLNFPSFDIFSYGFLINVRKIAIFDIFLNGA